jgi:hypothetical protein
MARRHVVKIRNSLFLVPDISDDQIARSDLETSLQQSNPGHQLNSKSYGNSFEIGDVKDGAH